MTGVVARAPSRAYSESDVVPVDESGGDGIGMNVVAGRATGANLLRLACEIHADLSERVGPGVVAGVRAADDLLGPVPHTVDDQTRRRNHLDDRLPRDTVHRGSDGGLALTNGGHEAGRRYGSHARIAGDPRSRTSADGVARRGRIGGRSRDRGGGELNRSAHHDPRGSRRDDDEIHRSDERPGRERGHLSLPQRLPLEALDGRRDNERVGRLGIELHVRDEVDAEPTRLQHGLPRHELTVLHQLDRLFGDRPRVHRLAEDERQHTVHRHVRLLSARVAADDDRCRGAGYWNSDRPRDSASSGRYDRDRVPGLCADRHGVEPAVIHGRGDERPGGGIERLRCESVEHCAWGNGHVCHTVFRRAARLRDSRRPRGR